MIKELTKTRSGLVVLAWKEKPHIWWEWGWWWWWWWTAVISADWRGQDGWWCWQGWRSPTLTPPATVFLPLTINSPPSQKSPERVFPSSNCAKKSITYEMGREVSTQWRNVTINSVYSTFSLVINCDQERVITNHKSLVIQGSFESFVKTFVFVFHENINNNNGIPNNDRSFNILKHYSRVRDFEMLWY